MSGNIGQERHLAALMRAAQAGDRQAYSALLRALLPLIREAVRHRFTFLQPHDIDDLVQDILLSLHTSRATYDPSRAFLPWLMAIVRNRMADGARRYIRRSAHEVVVDRLPETFSDADPNTIDDRYGDPEALRLAVKALPEGQRRAIELLKLREMSLKEAAAHSGASIAALKVSVHRGVTALRRMLAGKD